MTEAERLVEQLQAIGEEEMYLAPATTYATIQEAATLIHQQAARIRELERALEGIANITQPRLAKEETSFEMRDAAVAALTAYRSARP